VKRFTSAKKRLTNGLTPIGSNATNANKRLTMNNFSDTLNGVMDDYNIEPIEDFAVTYASQDEMDCERDIMGTNPEDGWFDERDEETSDMSALSPAFRELYDEYTDEEEDEDYE